MGVTTYYRNGLFTSSVSDPTSNPLDSNSYNRSWLGRNKGDLDKSVQFVRVTCDAKGPYYALIALGKSITVAEAVAAKHDIHIQDLPSSVEPEISLYYPVLFPNSQKAYRFSIELPSSPSADLIPQLLDLPIIDDISKLVSEKLQIFAFLKPTLAELRAEKQSRKPAHGKRSMKGPLDKDRTNERTDLNAAVEVKSFKSPEWTWPYSPSAVGKWATKADYWL